MRVLLPPSCPKSASTNTTRAIQLLLSDPIKVIRHHHCCRHRHRNRTIRPHHRCRHRIDVTRVRDEEVAYPPDESLHPWHPWPPWHPSLRI